MSKGNKYMVYSRDEGGRVTRTHRTVVLQKTEIAADYPHPEKLTGWPEAVVFWGASSGMTNGMAPFSKAATQATA